MVGTRTSSEVGSASAATTDAPSSAAFSQVQEVSSSSKETVVVSPSQEASASTLRSVEELALAPSVSPKSINNLLRMVEGSSIASGAAN
ncbi:hypothetical protein AMTR_s00015p00217760 [Amborella trichopoda]|uniref:Uncharacterized protein n=1 Tax=Amborella trichopoda TaxID=13333 RepID=W1PNY4_AMBTC|nr:hypothetical protein AMTR_s00015p00217760 [Amborella trichopoda]